MMQEYRHRRFSLPSTSTSQPCRGNDRCLPVPSSEVRGCSKHAVLQQMGKQVLAKVIQSKV